MQGRDATHWRDILPVHPKADIFPLLPPDELAELAEDIKQNGLRQPPVVGRDANDVRGRGDGGHRLEAMELLGYQFTAMDARDDCLHVRPLGPENGTKIQVRDIYGEDAALFIVSANIRRRHLTPAERADLALRVMESAGETVGHPAVSSGGRGHKSLAGKVAEVAGVSKDTALEQIAVRADPDLRAKVESGKITSSEAGREVRDRVAPKKPAGDAVLAVTAAVRGFFDRTLRWNGEDLTYRAIIRIAIENPTALQLRDNIAPTALLARDLGEALDQMQREALSLASQLPHPTRGSPDSIRLIARSEQPAVEQVEAACEAARAVVRLLDSADLPDVPAEQREAVSDRLKETSALFARAADRLEGTDGLVAVESRTPCTDAPEGHAPWCKGNCRP